MIVDTSAWVEYLRKTGGPFHLTLRASVRSGQPIATPAAAITELLSGTNSDNRASELLKLLNRFEILVANSIGEYEGAARIYRICRRAGYTIRSTVDCLVAATAVDKGRPLLARDRDFAVIARHTELQLVIPPDPGPPRRPPRGWSGE